MAVKTFAVDISTIIHAANKLDSMPFDLIPRLSSELQVIAKETLFEVFAEAVIQANSQGGFPAPFQAHVLSSIQHLPILPIVNGTLITVFVDFDILGTESDLRRAFHQGAKLTGGGGRDGYLWGPYNGQELVSKDAAKRYVAWNAVANDSGAYKFGGPKSKTYYLPEWASWENTINQRIAIWGDRAPEWLYVQFGQEEWSPKIPAGSVIEDFYSTLKIQSEILVARELADFVRAAQVYPFPIAGVARGRGARYREVSSGQFIQNV